MRFCKDCIYYVGRKHKNGMYCRKHREHVSPYNKACKDIITVKQWRLGKRKKQSFMVSQYGV